MTQSIEKTRNFVIKESLLKKYPPDKVDIWLIKGEDENPDFGGCHYKPIIGYFKGKYEDIVDYAINHPRFFTWGAGGSIELIKVINIE